MISKKQPLQGKNRSCMLKWKENDYEKAITKFLTYYFII
jgi:hypothetical protein